VPDPGLRSALIDFFRRGEVARDVRLLAAEGALAPRAQEQLALLMLLADDPDREIARAANCTLDALPPGPLAAFLSRDDVPREMKVFFAARGIESADAPLPGSEDDAPLLDTLSDIPDAPQGEAEDADPKRLSSLPVLERMKLAIKGSREQRAQLVRDTNRLVAAAVLSSPKLNEAEVEAFTKMGNVSEDTMRTIGRNRGWLKNYAILTGVCRHPKTPPAISMQLVHRLNDRDLKGLTTDRNVQEGLRQLARKVLGKGGV
jgi:hypothetical protein